MLFAFNSTFSIWFGVIHLSFCCLDWNSSEQIQMKWWADRSRKERERIELSTGWECFYYGRQNFCWLCDYIANRRIEANNEWLGRHSWLESHEEIVFSFRFPSALRNVFTSHWFHLSWRTDKCTTIYKCIFELLECYRIEKCATMTNQIRKRKKKEK